MEKVAGYAILLVLLVLLLMGLAHEQAETPSRDTVRRYIKATNGNLSPSQVLAIADALFYASRLSGVPVPVLVALAEVESTFRPWAYRDDTGASGLMQVRYIAFQQVLQTYPHLIDKTAWQQVLQPRVGALIGALYLAWILERGFTLHNALARYGGGEENPSPAYADRVFAALNSFSTFEIRNRQLGG